MTTVLPCGLAAVSALCVNQEPCSTTREVEFAFEPQDEGAHHVYAPELPSLHTQSETLEEATDNAREAMAHYVEGLRDDGRSLDFGIIRRTLPLSP